MSEDNNTSKVQGRMRRSFLDLEFLNKIEGKISPSSKKKIDKDILAGYLF